jgi:hypothetical protein
VDRHVRGGARRDSAHLPGKPPFSTAGGQQTGGDEPGKVPPAPKTDAAEKNKLEPDQPEPDKREVPWAKNIAAWKNRTSNEPADNSYCNVCHANYDNEKLSRVHKLAGVGCETCHGVSDKHSEDEDGLTPPEIMFPKADVLAFCMECHAKQDLLGTDEHKEIFGEEPNAESTCTSCHGKQHQLKVRTRRWNKTTGKLDWYDGVRMMQERDG